MNDNEFYKFEDRAYINPTLSSGEQEAFITNLRDVQSQNNQKIASDTHNLGTDVPSNLGGLGGGESYFDSRYQTPQVNEMVDTLKSAAQAQALNDVMSNYQNQLQNRYKQAYRKYQKRQRARQSSASGSGTKLPSSGTPDNPVDTKTTDIPVDKRKYGSAMSDPSFQYSMTQYMYSPTGEMITEYNNPKTGKTYKFIGDSLVQNGKKSTLLGNFYMNYLSRTGKFPGDA